MKALIAIWTLIACFIVTDAQSQEFYSNGNALDEWDEYSNRRFTDGDGVTHVGYFQTWHFLKARPSDPFWIQRQVVRTYDQPNKKWYYDQTTRVWVGVWDGDLDMYAKLPKSKRRHRISDIPTRDFPEANVIPYLAELTPTFNGRIPSDSVLMSEPPDTTRSRKVSDDSKNINDTLGPGSTTKKQCNGSCSSRRRAWGHRHWRKFR